MVGTIHQESTISEGGKTFKLTTDITLTEQGTTPPPPEPPPPQGRPPYPQDDGWYPQKTAANKNATTWKTTEMSKNKAWTKVVDSKEINVAVEFRTKTNAQKFIDYYRWTQSHAGQECDAGYVWNATENVYGGCVPIPVDHQCPEGQHWDEDQQKCVDDITPPPPTPPPSDVELDKFGIKKLYRDNTTKLSEFWYLAGNPKDDRRLKLSGTVEDLGNGRWLGRVTSGMNPPSFRLNVRNTNPLAGDTNAQAEKGSDWQVCRQTGSLLDERDYLNYEGTIVFKVTKISDPDEMTIYSGGNHGSEPFPTQCIAYAYKMQVRTDGTTRFAKQHHHVDSTGYTFFNGNPQFKIEGGLLNKKIAMKGVRIQKENHVVRLEVWVDQDPDSGKNEFKLMNWFEDTGNDVAVPQNDEYIQACNTAGNPKMSFDWASPLVVFRIDNVEVEFEKASVREITLS